MEAQIKQGNFSHCKCQYCNYFSIESNFNPRLVPIHESNLPNIKFEKNENEWPMMTFIYNCPICDSPFVEPYFADELN